MRKTRKFSQFKLCVKKHGITEKAIVSSFVSISGIKFRV